MAIDQPPVNSQELLLRETVRQNARHVVYYAFQFARAEATALEPPATTAPTTSKSVRGRNVAQAAAAASGHLAQLQSQLDQIKTEMAAAPRDALEALTAKRDRLIAEINLVTAQRDTMQSFSAFMTDSENGDAASLLRRIDDLEQSTPEVQEAPQKSGDGDTAATVTTATAAAAQPAYHPEASGIFSLVAEMFSLTSRMRDLHVLADQAGKLKQTNERFRGPIRGGIMEAIHRGDAIATTQESDDPDQLRGQRDELDVLAARFKLLAAAGVPLGEQDVMLETAHQNLLAWHAAIASQYSSALRSLLIRLGVLTLTAGILFGISELWRRATFRYVVDTRRRRQLMLIRRIVIGCVVVLIIAASVVSEFGSLATFAGLITAGIAVALQTVILSGVAYFFFIGRFGVRVGDRVTITGITGDVVEIGLFRIYLLELGGARLDLHPTGRVVVFSNAVLFQPSAFYKQIPGADYVWHEISFTLSPDTEMGLVERRLMAAVESVFVGYRDVIDRQHASISSTLQEQMISPRPEGRLRFVDAGLELVVRYPVEIRRASEIDDQITRKLLEAIESEPRLKIVPSAAPKIQPAPPK